jgi:hypothetical protein
MARFIKYKTVELGTQSITIEKKVSDKIDNRYYNRPGPITIGKCRIIYQDEKHSGLFSSFQKLSDFLKRKSINIENLVREKKQEFAEFFCIFADFGRVVTNHELYSGLKKNYGIEDLDKHLPNLDGNTLIFLTFKPNLSNPYSPIKEIRWFLDDLTYQEIIIYESLIRL